MRVDGTVVMKAPREQVWELFNEQGALARATPGCQRLTRVGEDSYEAELTMGIAAIKGRYAGKLQLQDKQPPAHYRLHIEGTGAPGFVSGSGTFDFSEAATDETSIGYVWDVQVGGLIAGVGQRMLGGVAKLLINQFFQSMQQELRGRRGEP